MSTGDLIKRMRNAVDWQKGVMPSVVNGWADELEQAEREAVGQGGQELPNCEMCDAEITNNTVVCTNCWNRVAPLAAPRPEASTRELRELVADLRSSKAYGNSEVSKTVLEAVNHIADRIEAALAAQPEQEKPNPLIVNAVRLAYYTGDFKGAIDVIAEAVGENVLASGGKAANLAAEGET